MYNITTLLRRRSSFGSYIGRHDDSMVVNFLNFSNPKRHICWRDCTSRIVSSIPFSFLDNQNNTTYLRKKKMCESSSPSEWSESNCRLGRWQKPPPVDAAYCTQVAWSTIFATALPKGNHKHTHWSVAKAPAFLMPIAGARYTPGPRGQTRPSPW